MRIEEVAVISGDGHVAGFEVVDQKTVGGIGDGTVAKEGRGGISLVVGGNGTYTILVGGMTAVDSVGGGNQPLNAQSIGINAAEYGLYSQPLTLQLEVVDRFSRGAYHNAGTAHAVIGEQGLRRSGTVEITKMIESVGGDEKTVAVGKEDGGLGIDVGMGCGVRSELTDTKRTVGGKMEKLAAGFGHDMNLLGIYIMWKSRRRDSKDVDCGVAYGAVPIFERIIT